MAKFTERKLPAGEIIAALNDESKYNGADRYATTKLIGLLWAKELANRIEKEEIVVNAPNPGFCKTSLMNDSSGVMKVLVKALSAGVGRSAEDGAKCVVDAAIIKGSDSHGRYLSETKIKDEADMARGDEGKQLQSKLWEEIVNVLKEKKVFPNSNRVLNCSHGPV
jgi:NAD(P)-dependent dehydrogenase (short-subunit alcohol dehydrogenase family)